MRTCRETFVGGQNDLFGCLDIFWQLRTTDVLEICLGNALSAAALHTGQWLATSDDMIAR